MEEDSPPQNNMSDNNSGTVLPALGITNGNSSSSTVRQRRNSQNRRNYNNWASRVQQNPRLNRAPTRREDSNSNQVQTRQDDVTMNGNPSNTEVQSSPGEGNIEWETPAAVEQESSNMPGTGLPWVAAAHPAVRNRRPQDRSRSNYNNWVSRLHRNPRSDPPPFPSNGSQQEDDQDTNIPSASAYAPNSNFRFDSEERANGGRQNVGRGRTDGRSLQRRETGRTNVSNSPERGSPSRGRGSRQNSHSGPNRQRVPPLRFRVISGGDSPSELQQGSDLLSFLSGPTLQGTGTEEEPFEVSSGDLSPDRDGAMGAGLETRQSLLSDEEFARQLQQEEWERMSDISEHNLLGGPPPPLGRHRRYSPRRMNHRRPGGNRGGHRDDEDRRLRSDFSAYMTLFHHPLLRQRYVLSDGSDSEGLNVLTAYLDAMMASADGFQELSGALDLDPQMHYESLLEMQDSIGDVDRGMSSTEINKLPIRKHNSGSRSATAAAASAEGSSQCNICLTDYEHGEEKRRLPCHHEFHSQCVDQWLKSKPTCPVCRGEVKGSRSP